MSAIQHFLLIYDHGLDKLVSQVDFGADIDSATVAYAEAEALHRNNPRMDIVLVGSDSIESVKVTHSTYFTGEGKRMIVSYLAQAFDNHEGHQTPA